MNRSPSKQQRTLWQLILVLALLIAVYVLFRAIGAFDAPPGQRRITLRVEASGGYSLITMQAGSESIREATTINTPWQKAYNLPSGTEVYLTAANPSQSGHVTCTLLLDGREWKTQSKTAPNDGVACAGIVP